MSIWGPSPAPHAVALVPIRSFSSGKSRLSAALDAEDRKGLVMAMAQAVVGAAAPLPVLVVTNDDEVAHWAEQMDAETFAPLSPGLNAAVAEGREALATSGVDRVVICHADIPRATTLEHLVGAGHNILLVSDAVGDGTNVLSIPTGLAFTFNYGPGSRDLHLEEATRRGYDLAVVSDPAWEHDVDEPSDL